MKSVSAQAALCVIELVFLARSALGQAQNLIPDPSFEADRQATPWTGGFILDGNVACTGRRSARLEDRSRYDST